MVERTIKLNKLGKPMVRDKNNRFVAGNKEGHLYGTDKPSEGRPKGTKNIMSIIKEIALAKDNTGQSNIEFVVISMLDAKKKLHKALEAMEPTHPAYMKALGNYTFLGAKIMEHIAKYSGDYTQKIQAEIGETLSDEEKAVMERMLNKKKS